jgi:hypothetical protein
MAERADQDLAGQSDAHPPRPSESRGWIEAYAAHVRKRFNGRAAVSVRVGEQEPTTLSQVYALEGGGLVLVVAGEDEGHEHPPGEHEHTEEEASPASDTEERGRELWIDSPAQAIFEARQAEDGALCTGFGYLGLSRTPQVLVPRSTEPPPDPGHHHGGF